MASARGRALARITAATLWRYSARFQRGVLAQDCESEHENENENEAGGGVRVAACGGVRRHAAAAGRAAWSAHLLGLLGAGKGGVHLGRAAGCGEQEREPGMEASEREPSGQSTAAIWGRRGCASRHRGTRIALPDAVCGV
jgi:hypothetical protein